ncbi:MAG: GSCFA domain-containing protein [Bacteroidales bacterium]|nr:GSCFA domain-containing protein [Bacteroidales bacterium]
MELMTKVAVSPSAFGLAQASDHIISVGSCFASEVAAKMQAAGFDMMVNPFGILFNPVSIAHCLDRCTDKSEMTPDLLVEADGRWHSWLHHGSFSSVTANQCLEACNTSIAEGHNYLRSATCLIVTFGTSWVFELIANGLVVGNCHKVSSSAFRRRRLTVDEVVEQWSHLIGKLKQFNPSLNIVFTVSPVRHKADGLHGNQLSKSVLLLAVDELCSRFASSGVTYFPAYEVVMDELRDYRFYADNMTHPSPLAVEVVWQRFQEVYLSSACREQARINTKQTKLSQHKPLYQS